MREKMHTDEQGRHVSAKSKVARKMRVALRGQKNYWRKDIAKRLKGSGAYYFRKMGG